MDKLQFLVLIFAVLLSKLCMCSICLTVLTISYVDSYRDIDSYVTILPSLPT